MLKRRNANIYLSLLLYASLLLITPGAIKTASLQTCYDNDLDGATNCAGDCDDFDWSYNLLDRDGDGFTTCAGDCDDDNPEVNRCNTRLVEEYADYTAWPEQSCFDIYWTTTEYKCQPGQNFSQCQYVREVRERYNSCTGPYPPARPW